MSNRVLNRTGARELALDEIQKVGGAIVSTLLSVLITNAPGGGFDEHHDT